MPLREVQERQPKVQIRLLSMQTGETCCWRPASATYSGRHTCCRHRLYTPKAAAESYSRSLAANPAQKLRSSMTASCLHLGPFGISRPDASCIRQLCHGPLEDRLRFALLASFRGAACTGINSVPFHRYPGSPHAVAHPNC